MFEVARIEYNDISTLIIVKSIVVVVILSPFEPRIREGREGGGWRRDGIEYTHEPSLVHFVSALALFVQIPCNQNYVHIQAHGIKW